MEDGRLLWTLAMALTSALGVLIISQYDVTLGVVAWLVLTIVLLWLRPT